MLLAALLPGPLAAQGRAAAPAPATAQAVLPAAERQALQLKGHGEFAASSQAWLALLRAARGGPYQAALAEYYASMAYQMARNTGHYRDYRAAIDEVRATPFAAAHPALRDRLGALGLAAARAAGDLDQITARAAKLGVLTRWQLLGPFDNERGAGLERQLPPEQRLDLDATYDGKERPVRWRPLPVEPPAGYVDLDALVRPNDQVLCYAATALISDRERTVLLHLGSDEAYRVFLNGRAVATRDVRRLFFPDQDAVPLVLAAGANLLVLKVCDQEGPYGFAARLTQADGSPLQGVRPSAAASDLKLAAATAPSEHAPAPTYRGARQLLAERIEQIGDPADCLRLAYLLATAQPDDPTQRRDHQLAVRAAAGFPELPEARFLLAFTRLRAAASTAEKDDNARRHDYQAILAMDRNHVQTLAALAMMDLESVGAAERAEVRLRHALEQNPHFVAGRLGLAQALRLRGLTVLAGRQVEQAAQGDSNPEADRALGKLLEDRGDLNGAQRALAASLAEAWNPDLAGDLATLLLRTGRRPDAVDLLRRAIALSPFDPAPHRQLARLFEVEGDLDAAIEQLRACLAICPADDDVLVDVARLDGIAGRTDAEIESLRAALALNPNRKTEVRLLQFLESDSTPFYDGYEIDGDEVVAKAPAIADPDANVPYDYLLSQRVVRAYRNGTTSEYRHQIVRLRNDEGCRRLATYAVQHYWGEQRARLLDVRIHKPDGSVQQPRFRGAVVQMPPLAIGDIVELRERVDDISPTYFGAYFGLEHDFVPRDGAPCRRSELVVLLDPGRDYRFQTRGGVPDAPAEQRDDGVEVRRYAMTDLPRRIVEENRPAPAESEPLVRITTYADWNVFAAWWWNLIRRQLEVSPAMRAKIAELVAHCDSEDARIAAIYRFVTTEIRYTAWEFGVHGYKPYSTPVIFERRHGDCKDKALLLAAMLGEIGVEAYPVLIHAEPRRSTDDLTLPLIHHFNHCITYLPPHGDRPGRFLDGTATYHPPDTLPSMDQGASVVVVERGHAELLQTPWTTAEANELGQGLDAVLDRDGTARVHFELRPEGNTAVPVREALGNEPGQRRQRIEQRLAQMLGKVSVLSVHASDMLDLDHAVELDVDLSADELATPREGGLELRAALTGRPLGPLVAANARQLPLLLGPPEAMKSTCRYRLPAGMAPLQLPAPVELSTPFGRYRMVWSFGDGVLQVERQRALLNHRIEPAEYPDFRNFALSADRADRQKVILRREGNR